MGRKALMALAALLLFNSLVLTHADDESPLEVTDEEDVEDIGDQRPFLLARKFFPEKNLVLGKNSTVAVELYNAGNSAAYDVTVVESNSWDTKFVEFSGPTTTETIERIPAGGTAKVLFYITPIQVGHGTASPALVTYKSEEDGSDLQVAHTTPLPLSIITPFQFRVGDALRWGSYLTLGSFTTVEHWRTAALITFICALGGIGVWVYSTYNESRKRQKYQKALEEVEKMK